MLDMLYIFNNYSPKASELIIGEYSPRRSRGEYFQKITEPEATSQARAFTNARRCGKDPGWSWSRDSFKNLLLYGVGKVSNYMLPHTCDTFQMQGARFNCYE